jgi:hypothetical protein
MAGQPPLQRWPGKLKQSTIKSMKRNNKFQVRISKFLEDELKMTKTILRLLQPT